MQKMFVVLMLLSMMCTFCTVSAEEYQLHSGITFGMTKEEAIEKQKNRGNEFEMVDGRLKSVKDVIILSMPAEIYYDFDADGGIVRQQYRFDQAELNSLVMEFSKVYGEPDCTSTIGNKLALPQACFTGPLPSANEYGLAHVGINSSLVTYSVGSMEYVQWLVEVEGGSVAIEIYGRSYAAKVGTNARRTYGYCYLVDYRYFTAEEMEEAQQENADRYKDI